MRLKIKDYDNEALPGYNYWNDEHAKYPLSDWKISVREDDTRLGYWAWVKTMIAME